MNTLQPGAGLSARPPAPAHMTAGQAHTATAAKNQSRTLAGPPSSPETGRSSPTNRHSDAANLQRVTWWQFTDPGVPVMGIQTAGEDDPQELARPPLLRERRGALWRTARFDHRGQSKKAVPLWAAESSAVFQVRCPLQLRLRLEGRGTPVQLSWDVSLPFESDVPLSAP